MIQLQSSALDGGDETHELALTKRNWAKARAGSRFTLRGKGYRYDGEFFGDYWDFNHSGPGSLVVRYGDDGGCGYDGDLGDALVPADPSD